MKKIFLPNVLLLLMILVIFPFGTALAATVIYNTTDLGDVNPGEDLWQYSYTVSGYTYNTDYGFTIWFDENQYGAIDPLPSPPNMDWDVITWDPAPSIFDPGAYDALALVDGASLAETFEIAFVWLGSSTPGSQDFDVYFFDGADYSVIDTGQTAPVPVPHSILLLGSGVFGLAVLRRNLKTPS
jgi:hypothetical protein